jgi:hypothetical protein
MILKDGIGNKKQGIWATLCLAKNNFTQIDGKEWAGAFAFNAFFSLFPYKEVLPEFVAVSRKPFLVTRIIPDRLD